MYPDLLHCNDRSDPLHRFYDFLALFLGHRLLHCLGRTLHKLLTIHQAQPEHALDLLDDLRFRRRLK